MKIKLRQRDGILWGKARIYLSVHGGVDIIKDTFPLTITNSWMIETGILEGRQNMFSLERSLKLLQTSGKSTMFKLNAVLVELDSGYPKSCRVDKFIVLGLSAILLEDLKDAIREIKDLMPLRYKLYYKFINLFK